MARRAVGLRRTNSHRLMSALSDPWPPRIEFVCVGLTSIGYFAPWIFDRSTAPSSDYRSVCLETVLGDRFRVFRVFRVRSEQVEALRRRWLELRD